jgi:hypothetical protein
MICAARYDSWRPADALGREKDLRTSSHEDSDKEEIKMSEQEFPPGWDEKRVKDLIAHYENQTEDEEFADIEAALEAEDVTLMAIPTELVPEVRALLARKQSA